MLKKRLVGVVTVKDGWAVQSIGYRRYLPLGKPECLVENLDRWGADEILVLVIDRARHGRGPDFELLNKLARIGISTPLIYGGGITSVEDGIRTIQAGADRLVLDALLHDDPAVVRELCSRLGAQAVIAALPMAHSDGKVNWLDYRNQQSKVISPDVTELLEGGIVSEALLIDWMNEGTRGGFQSALVQHFPLSHVPLIVFGGISEPEQFSQLLQNERVAAVAVGNFLNYREHAIQNLRTALSTTPLRLPVFKSKHASFLNV